MAGKKTGAVRKSFTAVLEPDGTALRWVVARLPFDVAKTWPVRKGRRVRGEIEGFAFRTTLFPRPGGGEHLLLVNKKMLAGAGVRRGEKARIWLEPDLEEREILLPEELKRELNSDRGLRKWFGGLSDSMRREIGKWADEPKSPASRQKRAEKMAERLMQAMEGEQEPPPVLKAIFQRQPRARDAWFARTRRSGGITCWASFIMRRPKGGSGGRRRRLGKAGSEGARERGSKKAGNRE